MVGASARPACQRAVLFYRQGRPGYPNRRFGLPRPISFETRRNLTDARGAGILARNEKRAGAFSAAMSRIPHHHKAERPFQASLAEAERLARAQKNARLKDLRTHASWLVLDPQAHFHEEIDCSALLGDLPIRKVIREG